MKQTIRLNESGLKQIIKETVKRVLNEGDGKFTKLYNDPHIFDEDEGCTYVIEKLKKELNQKRSEFYEYEKETLERIKELQQWAYDHFTDYASKKYGLTADNLDKNWENFCDTKNGFYPFEPPYYY